MSRSDRGGSVHSSILFSNSFKASNSSFDRVTPFPILVPSADQSRRSYFGSRSFQLTRLSSFAQPEPAFDTTPIFFTISYLISAIDLLSLLGLRPVRFPKGSERDRTLSAYGP